MKCLKTIKAEGYIIPCVFIWIFAMVFAIIFMYASAISTVNMMKENTKVVLDSFVTQNSKLIYNSIKQGNDYTEEIDSDEFCNTLISFCTLEIKNGKLYSIDANGNEQYFISIPIISYRQENELELVVNYTLSLPIKFAEKEVLTVEIPVEISSILTEKT